MNVSRLSNAVISVLGLNPGPFTLNGTNTYIVGSGKERILIDTGEGRPEYQQLLQKTLKNNRIVLTSVILTHEHPDHVGGIEQVESMFPGIKIYRNKPARNQEIAIGNGYKFTVQGATLEAFETPGHSNDHLCIFMKEERAIFTGDLILGTGTTSIQDLRVYMDSLDKCERFQPVKLYPGHGPVVENAMAKIKEYRNHRKDRENEIKAIIQKPTTIKGIVSVIYKNYPKEVLDAAARSVALHLQKLREEGLVLIDESNGERFYILRRNKL